MSATSLRQRWLERLSVAGVAARLGRSEGAVLALVSRDFAGLSARLGRGAGPRE